MILHMCLPQFFTVIVFSFLLSQTSFAELRRRRHDHVADIVSRIQELSSKWSCRVPRERLIYVHTVVNAPDVISWRPSAVVLFQCEAATGCCTKPAETCRYNETESVSFVFEKIGDLDVSYQRLNFTNHTSCSCQPSTLSQLTSQTNSSYRAR